MQVESQDEGERPEITQDIIRRRRSHLK